MNIDIIAYGTWGDVRPSLAAGRLLHQAGYQVQLILTEDFEGQAKQTGLPYSLLPIDKRRLMRSVSSQTNPLRGALAIRRQIAPALLEAGRLLPSLTATADALVVNEWTLAIAAAIAERHGQQILRLSTKPRLKTHQHPIPTMPPLPDWLPGGHAYNRLTYDWARLTRWWTYANVSNSLRRNQLGLPALSFRQYRRLFERTPSVTLVSRHVVPRPSDWAEHHHQTGYLFYEDGDWQPTAELTEFLENGEPPVYFGFGSMHDEDPRATTQVIMQALKRCGQRAILYRGWADLGRADMPQDTILVDYVPHEWLFPQMKAVVHHAGAGTTAAALRAGAPSIPVPHSGDQSFWARRLHQLGAGSKPLPRQHLEVKPLLRRIQMVERNPKLKQSAAILGQKIEAEPAAELTIAAFRQILGQ